MPESFDISNYVIIMVHVMYHNEHLYSPKQATRQTEKTIYTGK